MALVGMPNFNSNRVLKYSLIMFFGCRFDCEFMVCKKLKMDLGECHEQKLVSIGMVDLRKSASGGSAFYFGSVVRLSSLAFLSIGVSNYCRRQ